MILLRVLFAVLLAISAASAQAQASAEEISFWESVRNSGNAVELQAYLDRYPNGAFAPLAQARLAALGSKAASKPAAAVPPPAPQASAGPPQVGDTWTYRVSHARLRGKFGVTLPPPATYVIKVDSVSGAEIVDELSVDGGAPRRTTHTKGPYLISQGMSVYSPYFETLHGSVVNARLGTVDIRDPACQRTYRCEANARVLGQETVTVPAGQFLATKVLVTESWQAGTLTGYRMNGGRTMTIWYSPQAKRAIKYESRPTVGDNTPIEPNFDLELMSYQLK